MKYKNTNRFLTYLLNKHTLLANPQEGTDEELSHPKH